MQDDDAEKRSRNSDDVQGSSENRSVPLLEICLQVGNDDVSVNVVTFSENGCHVLLEVDHHVFRERLQGVCLEVV